MSVVISSTGELTIAGQPFSCSGSYGGTGQWLINAGWVAQPGQSISIGSILSQIGGGINFDPNGLLPSVNFTSIQVVFAQGSKYSFQCTADITWDKPFGIPLGLDIDDLNFSLVKHLNTPVQIQATGKVSINQLQAKVGVYFTGGSPVLILVNQIADFSLSVLITQFFGTSVSIPNDFIDLTLANAQVYYLATGAALPAGVIILSPQAGLNVAALCTFELAGYQFPNLNVSVNVASGNGVQLSGTFFNPIGFTFFLTLTGANAGYTGGPTLSVSTQNGAKQFRLNCGLQFFNENFGTGGLTIENKQGKTTFNANLTYNGTIGPFTNPSLAMSYDGTNFEITNWPGVAVANPVIDFAKALKDINSASGCGKVLDIVFNQVIETNFSISPSFTTKKPNIPGVAQGQFYLVLNGFYTISAAGTVVCSINLPKLALSFKLPSEFNFNGIITAIRTNIAENAQAIVQELVNDKKALAQFILVFAGKAGAQKILSQICDKALQALLNSFIAELGPIAGGVLGALGAGAGALASLGCGSSSGSNGGGGGSPNINPLATPQITSESLNGNNWTIHWNTVIGTNYYQAIFKDNNGKIMDQQFVASGSPANLIFTDQFQNAPYTCQVVAWANPGFNYNSAPAQIVLNQLAQPTTLTAAIDYKTGKLTATFSSVPNASGYQVNTYNETGVVVAQTTSTGINPQGQITAEFTILNFTPFPTTYQAGVVCEGGSTYIPSAELKNQQQPLNWGVGYTEIDDTFNVS
ncbi:hypothetical protein [Flavobacterium sp. UGB4466]|uniref:hypothetical protein n=1 Tax=Flavobacterium sp. UGB4466 TaxID=2730889 RepID=UPI00192AD1B2|nr:hypothetical protein [Flavobacterium sp. UGB4466]